MERADFFDWQAEFAPSTGLSMKSPRTTASRQPCRKHDQQGLLRSTRSVTRTRRHWTKTSICPERYGVLTLAPGAFPQYRSTFRIIPK